MPNRQLRLFPLNTVLFPGVVLHLHVFEPRYKQLIDECLAEQVPFGVVLISEGGEAGDPSVMPYDVGTVAHIREVTRLPFERYYVSTIGCERFRIEEIVFRQPYLTGRVVYLSDERLPDKRCTNLANEVRTILREYLWLLLDVCASDAKVDLPSDARSTSYITADSLRISNPLKQRLLELPSTKQRLTIEIRLLRRLVPQLRKLLERRQSAIDGAPETTADAVFRVRQDKLFGKHFSVN
ncbi:MAG: LON peptidase substrate-binding domain-containing protein [Candidatus Eremiobacteraeota bacterium]|nr:LON peptidase substrate-binding domain-containing protein [Candidatus Eremiobacteraeota bacterium]